jgi:ADP-ribosylglycohydrolase
VNLPAERLDRARTALEGLSVGDALGGWFEFTHPDAIARAVTTRTLPGPPWHFTDDTNMALSVFATLRTRGGIHPDTLAASFARHYHQARGYGPAMHGLLARIREGIPWAQAAGSLFEGQGSFGNGAAMRVAPVGAYFADDLDAAADHARRSAAVTHAHPEAAAGAIAVAIAAAIAWQQRDTVPRPTRASFLDRIVPHVPDSDVRAGLRKARDFTPNASLQHAVAVLGNGSRVTCQDTVPFTLWCAGEHLNDYANAIWTTLSAGGDADTTCAIVGGIVAMATGIEGIPAGWRTSRETLPAWAFED